MDEGHTPIHRDCVGSSLEDCDIDQILERLSWTPVERLRYLLDMLEFEARARRAKRLDPSAPI